MGLREWFFAPLLQREAAVDRMLFEVLRVSASQAETSARLGALASDLLHREAAPLPLPARREPLQPEWVMVDPDAIGFDGDL